MACSVRLNKCKREKIVAYAEELIECPAHAEAEEKAYKKALKTILAQYKIELPEEEMAILRKYEGLKITKALSVKTKNGDKGGLGGYHGERGIIFPFIDEKGEPIELEYPSTVGRRHSGFYFHCHFSDTGNAVIMPDLVAWHKAKKAHTQEREKYLKVIRSVVYDKNTLAQVGEVWAPAMDLASELGGVDPLTDSTVQKLKDLEAERIRVLSEAPINSVTRRSDALKEKLRKTCG